jgi:hypothetical protein
VLISKTCHCVGWEFLTAVVMKSTTVFWDITPCSPLRVNRRFGGTYCLNLGLPSALMLVCSVYSTPKMEANRSSGTSIDLQDSTRHSVPEDRTHHWLVRCVLWWRRAWKVRVAIRSVVLTHMEYHNVLCWFKGYFWVQKLHVFNTNFLLETAVETIYNF